MKTQAKVILTLLSLGSAATLLLAQDGQPQDGQRPPRPQGQGQGGPGMGGQRPPVPPLIAALDANHDGTIDETEIANASNLLKTLDKNGDGKLTREELRPPMPQGQGGPNGPRGPRPDGFGPNGDRPEPPQGDQ